MKQKAEETATAGQFLTFYVAEDEYALPILTVKEIIAYDTLTRVPNAASYIRGIINLRGSVVPVVDLSRKFGLDATAVTRSTCIVIVEATVTDEKLVVGLMVDAVSQVIELNTEDIEAPPQFGTISGDILVGMARSAAARKFVLLLDIDKLLNSVDVAISPMETGAAVEAGAQQASVEFADATA